MTDINAIERLKKSPPLKAADIVLIAALLLTAAGLLLARAFQKDGDTVEITFDGGTVSYALIENRTLHISGMEIVIEGGVVYVAASDCPDRLCTGASHAIKSVGERIVCLPNRVVISIKGSSDIQIISG